MNKYDASRILGLSGTFTADQVQEAVRKLRSKYHPDRNEHGLEMTQMINAAYEVLKAGDTVERKDTDKDHNEEILEAIRVATACEGLVVELCGVWVWVSGEAKTHKETLKAAGFKYSGKKKMWYFRTSEFNGRRYGKSESDMDSIRTKYGSKRQTCNPNARPALAASV